MKDLSNLVFHTVPSDADEFLIRIKETGHVPYSREADSAGLIAFKFKSLPISDIKLILEKAKGLNAKRAYFGIPSASGGIRDT